MMQRLFIFDLDGTIADTIWSIREAVNLTMEEYGYSTRSYDEVRLAIGNGARELIRKSLPADKRADEDHVTEVFAHYEQNYEQTYTHVEGCYSGVRDAVLELKQKGNTLAVLSNKQDLYTKRIIDLLFPEMPFSFVQGQTDLPRKPDPTVPRMIMNQLGFAPKDTLFIGDSDVDIYTAHNAGMMAVGCAWGYRGETVLREAGADVILTNGYALVTL